MENRKSIENSKYVKYVVRFVRPIDIGKLGAIKIFVILTAIITSYIEWQGFYDFFVPNGILLNWSVAIVIILFPAFIVFLFLNYFWCNEYTEHKKTKKEKNELKKELGISEERCLTDVTTGVPNSECLKEDIDNNFFKNNKEMKCIFIDLKDFSIINDKFGFNKTNDLLRTIAQAIYKKMRRDEKMYRMYPGGDEFIFILFGNQKAALGFSERLVLIFKGISDKTTQILGSHIDLSFYCAIVEIYNNDSYENLLKRIESAKTNLFPKN